MRSVWSGVIVECFNLSYISANWHDITSLNYSSSSMDWLAKSVCLIFDVSLMMFMESDLPWLMSSAILEKSASKTNSTLLRSKKPATIVSSTWAEIPCFRRTWNMNSFAWACRRIEILASSCTSTASLTACSSNFWFYRHRMAGTLFPRTLS